MKTKEDIHLLPSNNWVYFRRIRLIYIDPCDGWVKHRPPECPVGDGQHQVQIRYPRCPEAGVSVPTSDRQVCPGYWAALSPQGCHWRWYVIIHVYIILLFLPLLTGTCYIYLIITCWRLDVEVNDTLVVIVSWYTVYDMHWFIYSWM